MAWVKMRNSQGTVVEIPEPVYNNMFKQYKGFTLVIDTPKQETNKQSEVLEDGREQVQEPELDVGKAPRKTKSKAGI